MLRVIKTPTKLKKLAAFIKKYKLDKSYCFLEEVRGDIKDNYIYLTVDQCTARFIDPTTETDVIIKKPLPAENEVFYEKDLLTRSTIFYFMLESHKLWTLSVSQEAFIDGLIEKGIILGFLQSLNYVK